MIYRPAGFTPTPWEVGISTFNDQKHISVVQTNDASKIVALCGFAGAEDELESVANALMISKLANRAASTDTGIEVTTEKMLSLCHTDATISIAAIAFEYGKLGFSQKDPEFRLLQQAARFIELARDSCENRFHRTQEKSAI